MALARHSEGNVEVEAGDRGTEGRDFARTEHMITWMFFCGSLRA